jgi:uncharacterized membrane protein SpoIIM required for sporulation
MGERGLPAGFSYIYNSINRMRETDFINQNKEKWDEFEKILNSPKKDPDKLSNLFIQISDDLSYSRTYYRNRSVRIYLNNLAQQVFTTLYKNKKTRLSGFRAFWKEELPQLIWSSRRALLTSFIVFAISVGIGIFSCSQDPEFPRVILGDAYVNMTIENIKKHDPMAVYKKMHEVDMFLGIALNNLMVSVLIFILGLVFSIGSVGYIAYNGIMVGTFQYFFYQQGLFAESALTIWMHGTLELSAIVIAGAAGITMGNGLVFPGTYSRSQSFMLSARRGLKILIGIAPIIVFAAIIESFVTRYTELPSFVRLSLIAFSLFFILGYFLWYPWKKARAGFMQPIREAQLRPNGEVRIDIAEIHSNGEIFKDVFGLYRKYFKKFFYSSLGIGSAYAISLFIFCRQIRDSSFENKNYFFITELFHYNRYPVLVILNLFLITALFFTSFFFIRQAIREDKAESKHTLRSLLILSGRCLLLSGFVNTLLLLQNGWSVFLLITCLPFVFLLGAVMTEKSSDIKASAVGRMFTLSGTHFWKFIGLFYLLALLVILFFLVLDSPFVFIYFEVLSWNFVMDTNTYHSVFIAFESLTSVMGLGLVLPLVMGGMSLLYHSLDEIRFATSLRRRIGSMGDKTNGKK